jgi:neutral ceramidase
MFVTYQSQFITNIGTVLCVDLAVNRNILQGSFVAAFASSNLGDVSPNVRGARCQFSGRPCDAHSSTCSGQREMCIASGPGVDMFDSTRIVAKKLFGKAWVSWGV